MTGTRVPTYQSHPTAKKGHFFLFTQAIIDTPARKARAPTTFHNAGIRSPVGTSYLPPEWRKVASERDPKKSYKNLWLVSRGPASHGCTRLDSGQMSELRHALPSTSRAMAGIPTYRNLPQCYEVFDIDGDGKAEVMGVEYFVAYQSKKHKPQPADDDAIEGKIRRAHAAGTQEGVEQPEERLDHVQRARPAKMKAQRNRRE